MSEQIISIDNSASLTIDKSRLKISQGDKNNFIVASDIAVLIISNPYVSLTAPVVTAITENSGLVVFTNSNYMPSSYCYANNSNNKGAIRPFLQANNIHAPQSAEAWSQVIKSKIKGQSLVLQSFKTKNYEYIVSAIDKVELGDTTNVEAQVARFYWEDYFSLFDVAINREKQKANNLINICLNYGYTVMRAIIARSLASLGLCLNFGIGHYRKDNPFNLVEDFIEPFRYIVDSIIYRNLYNNLEFDLESKTLGPKLKRLIIESIYDSTIIINNKEYRLIQGVHQTTNSYCNYLEGRVKRLLLPNINLSGKNFNIETKLENF